jgi:hypothetical protein
LRKIFKLEENNKNRDRTLESVKNEIRKYLKRERRKKLSDTSTMFWDFDCKFGKNKDDANVIEITEITKLLDITAKENWQECYVEILAKEVAKPIKEETVVETENIE